MQAADTTLTGLLKRDRVVVAAALAILTLLAWAYVLWLSAHMAMPGDLTATAPSDTMAGMDMDVEGGALAPAIRAWAPAGFAFMFAMWSVMMIGMMTPSVAPMVLLYIAA